MSAVDQRPMRAIDIMTFFFSIFNVYIPTPTGIVLGMSGELYRVRLLEFRVLFCAWGQTSWRGDADEYETVCLYLWALSLMSFLNFNLFSMDCGFEEHRTENQLNLQAILSNKCRIESIKCFVFPSFCFWGEITNVYIYVWEIHISLIAYYWHLLRHHLTNKKQPIHIQYMQKIKIILLTWKMVASMIFGGKRFLENI